jgi:hypothetical protein
MTLIMRSYLFSPRCALKTYNNLIGLELTIQGDYTLEKRMAQQRQIHITLFLCESKYVAQKDLI